MQLTIINFAFENINYNRKLTEFITYCLHIIRKRISHYKLENKNQTDLFLFL